MKRTRILAFLAILALFAFPLAAGSITLTWVDKDGTTQTTPLNNIADDLVTLISQHKGEIESALTASKLSSTDVDAAVAQATKAYNDFVGSNSSLKNPYTTTINGLNDFTDVILDAIPNAQIQQNVWANAWIGNLLPKPHFGFGINAGVSKLDLSPLASVADALGMSDSGSLPDTLVWPTVTADLRVGGFILPFDVGFTAMSFDSSKISSLEKAIDPAYFDFFMIGGDIRYAILKGGILRPKLSVGVGAYYTKGDFGVEQDGSSAELDFDSTSIVLSTQASIKLLFFVPFIGGKVMFTKSNVDWKMHANWASVLNTASSGDDISKALAYGLLPSDFKGGSESSFTDHVRPVIFGGFAFDMAVVDLTISGSYDFISKIPSGAVSLRFALN